MAPLLDVRDVSKAFVMHLRGGVRIPVLTGLTFAVRPGECLALSGPSGTGKSTVLRMIYGNYRADAGVIGVQHNGEEVDLARAAPRVILELRRRTVGYVSQFLRVIPRVPALSIVAEAGRIAGRPQEEADATAAAMLRCLNLPERLWTLPPATFSGGEQQRVNIARGFMGSHRLLLLDEPTASLDATNREVVVELILAAKARGIAILGIFHDTDVRDRVADGLVDVTRYAGAAA